MLFCLDNEYAVDSIFIKTLVGTRVADPDLFGRIRKMFTESSSCRYFGTVKLYKQGENILKIELLHIFR